MSDVPAFAAVWLRQRSSGAAAIEAIEAAELAALDDATALAQSEALLAATPYAAIAELRRATSGLVEQQRRFSLVRAGR